jgi:hypothetical protein
VLQFTFVQREWSAVFEAASRAEAAVYADPRTACFYARRALELAVSWAFMHDAALELPYQDNLSALIHEPSFKQEEGVQYHARDTAVMRGKFEDIPIILSTATPPIESRHMVELGRYREVSLSQRFAGAQLPNISAIDLTQDPPPRGVDRFHRHLAGGER